MSTSEPTDSKGKGSSRASSLPTPPDSAGEPSLSPSPSPSLLPSTEIYAGLSQPAQSAIQIIKSIKDGCGRPDNPWITLPIEPSDFSQLKKWLEIEDDLWGYVQDKIRYDYDSHTRVFIFRMPSGTHELFTDGVAFEANSQLRRFRDSTIRPDAATLAKSVENWASTDIKFQGDLDQGWHTHSPDISFGHIDAKYPSVIIETSFSQKRKDLPRLADDYILGSRGNIKLVIGLDIEYRASKIATVSVWKPKKGFEEDGVPYLCVEKVVDNEARPLFFRNDDSSSASSNAFLTIPLSTFALPGTVFPPSLDSVVSIPYTTLYSLLEMAEYKQQKINGPDGKEEELLPGTRIKKRQMTPEEQLEDDDEARFAMAEEKANRKAYNEDSAWKSKRTRR